MKKQFKISMILATIFCASVLPKYASAEFFWDRSNCNPCTNNAVYLSWQPNTYDIQVSALYLQPSASNLHYVAEAESSSLLTPNWKIRDIKPDYHWGFEVGISRFSHDKSTKTKLNYSYFHSEDEASKTVSTQDMVGPFFEIGSDASSYTRAKGHVDFDYNALDLDHGFCINFGDQIRTNFFAGVGGVSIEQRLRTLFSNSNKTIARRIKSPSKFLGIGPQLGVDFVFDVCSGFQLAGEGVATLLVGNLKNHTSYSSISPALAMAGVRQPNRQSTHVRDRIQVVPAFEGKLGLAYSFELCNYSIQSVDIGSEITTPPVTPDTVGVFARAFQRTLSNFALAGPYLTLNAAF
jgi:hypothetical protein